MSGTKQQWDFKSLRKIFQQKGWWKTHYIKPNLPYNKGVEVGNRGDLSNDIAPYATQEYKKNWQLGVSLLKPGYHPEKPNQEPAPGLFDAGDDPNEILRRKQLKAVSKLLDDLRSINIRLPNYGLELPQEIKSSLCRTEEKLKGI